MKNVNFGFSLGFPTGFNTSEYKSVIEYAVNHGCGYFRIYEVFQKGYNVDVFCDLVKFLTWYGKARLMICLSNLPWEWLTEFDMRVLTPKQFELTAFTNRFAPLPSQEERLRQLYTELVDGLKKRDVLKYCSFELGNEPDAANFSWCTQEEFKRATELRFEILRSLTDRPIVLGDFTSSLMRDKTYKGKQAWMDYIETTPMLDKAIFSHSFYHIDSSTVPFDLEKNSYPKRIFSETIISEYNIFTSFNRGSEREKIFNSPQYVSYLCSLLKLIYPKPVSTVLVHPLFGFPNDDTGKMALYKAKMPTPAAQYFWKVWGVIKLGYELLPNGIKGVTQSIVFDENGMYTIVKN